MEKNAKIYVAGHRGLVGGSIVRGLKEKGCHFLLDSPTNQQFVILENGRMEALAQQVRFSFWRRYDDTHSVVRFVTSWATTPDDVDALCNLLSHL